MASTAHHAHPKKIHLAAKHRESFTDNLGMLLNAGVPVGEALASLQQTTQSKPFRRALAQMQSDIDSGVPLWQALESSGIVSQQTLALVRLGEASGRLVENLRVAARQEEKQRIFRAKVRSALLYPVFVLGLTVIVGMGVAWFLLPRLAATFSQLNAELPAISSILINFGLFLRDNGIWAIPLGIVVTAFIGYIIFAAPRTKHIGQRLLFHLPGVGRLIREVEIAKFGYLLGTLLQAGLGVTQALDSLQAATTSPYYKKLYAHLAAAFEEGYNFKAGLQHYKGVHKIIPPAVQQMIFAGERSGALADTLINVGKVYEEKADVTTNNLEVILEPILLVVVWAGVMAVAVAVIMPIYSLIGGLQA
jgi:type II secretory pathway component PulF